MKLFEPARIATGLLAASPLGGQGAGARGAGAPWPSRLPVVRLYEQPPVEGYPWQDAAIAVAAGVALVALLLAVGAWIARRRLELHDPRAAVVARLSRACRLSAGQRRLLDLAESRSGIDLVAMLIVPSAFDRAMSAADVPAAAVGTLRGQLFRVDIKAQPRLVGRGRTNGR
jgi:hypothetical protein